MNNKSIYNILRFAVYYKYFYYSKLRRNKKWQ